MWWARESGLEALSTMAEQMRPYVSFQLRMTLLSLFLHNWTLLTIGMAVESLKSLVSLCLLIDRL